MHYWDGVTPLRALFDRLERLRERQKIRWYGITNHVPDNIMPLDYPGLVSASLEYSLVERAHERAAQQLAGAGLTFLAYGSLGQGILSGKYRAGDSFVGAGDRRSHPRYRNFHGERLARSSRIVEVLRSQAHELSASPSRLGPACHSRKCRSRRHQARRSVEGCTGRVAAEPPRGNLGCAR
jgi:aryl-alcohol dehydrogenase-like predicted oxidoreductase